MKQSSLLARVLLCACAAAPGLALAQGVTAGKNTPIATVPATVPATASVTDPAAAVPPVVYQSVFAGTPTGVEMESADWKKANAEVGQFKRGHVDILKWDEAQTKGPTPSQSSPLPTPPAARPTPAPSAPPTPPAPSLHKH